MERPPAETGALGLNRSSEASKVPRGARPEQARCRPQSLLRGIERGRAAGGRWGERSASIAPQRHRKVAAATAPRARLAASIAPQRHRKLPNESVAEVTVGGLNRSSEASKGAEHGDARGLGHEPQSLLRGIESLYTPTRAAAGGTPQSLLRGIERTEAPITNSRRRWPQSLLRGIERRPHVRGLRPRGRASIAPQRHRKILSAE